MKRVKKRDKGKQEKDTNTRTQQHLSAIIKTKHPLPCANASGSQEGQSVVGQRRDMEEHGQGQGLAIQFALEGGPVMSEPGTGQQQVGER